MHRIPPHSRLIARASLVALLMIPLACDTEPLDDDAPDPGHLEGFQADLSVAGAAPALAPDAASGASVAHGPEAAPSFAEPGSPQRMDRCVLEDGDDRIWCWPSGQSEPVMLELIEVQDDGCMLVEKPHIGASMGLSLCPNYLVPPSSDKSKPQDPLKDGLTAKAVSDPTEPSGEPVVPGDPTEPGEPPVEGEPKDLDEATEPGEPAG